MAAPDWKAFDFGKTKDEIIENLVDKFSYPADRGREVIPYFIQKAQEGGTRILISFAGEGFMERVKDSGTRDKFTSFMVEFMAKYGFDGIEIDWESDLDLTLHSVLMGEIRKNWMWPGSGWGKGCTLPRPCTRGRSTEKSLRTACRPALTGSTS